MILKHLLLQNFRNYTKAAFSFDSQATVIVGQNASGKTNLLEAIFLVSTGRSFKSEKENQLIQFGKTMARVKGDRAPVTPAKAETQKETNSSSKSGMAFSDDMDKEVLEVILSETPTNYLQRKYLVNGVSKRRVEFASHLPVVLFTPLDLDIVSGQPSARRTYLNDVLEQVDTDYRNALAVYTKALRQRNALLEQAQQNGARDEERFAYWDSLLVTHGQLITQKRKALIEYINEQDKPLYSFTLEYDASTISPERLLHYRQAETGAGVTLVGPQRDDILIKAYHRSSQKFEAVKHFSSRGQQRLVTLELKKLQMIYMKEQTSIQPLLLLDDIFSELDSVHSTHVLELIGEHQTILTTTHKEFIAQNIRKKPYVIELEHKA